MKRIILIFTIVLSLIFTGCHLHENSSSSLSGSPDTAPPYDSEQKQTDSQNTTESEQTRFDAFTESIFKEELSQNIISLHNTFAHPENFGIHSYSISFGDCSAEADAKIYQNLTSYLSALSTFHPEHLTRQQQLTYQIFKTYCEDSLKFKDYRLYNHYLSPNNGMQVYLPTLLTNYTFYDQQDVEDYFSALQQIPLFFQQLITFSKEQANAGLFMNDQQIDGSIASCQQFLSNREQHYLIDSFKERLQALTSLNKSDTEAYLKKNTVVLTETVFPAYEYLIQELTALKGTGITENGLANLKNGKKHYELLVRDATGSDKTVPEIQHLLEKQLEADFDEILTISLEQPEAVKQMELCPLDTTRPEAVLLHLYEQIKTDFPLKEKPAFSVQYVPSTMEECTNPAYYILPPLDMPQQNFIYINKSCITGTIEDFVTLAHEGFPGHLYQTTYYYACQPPLIRKLLGYNGYSEGWGTYAELYSYQFAGTDARTARLNQLNKTYSFGLYCLGDIGIHYEGWSRNETIQYYKKLGISEGNAAIIYETLLANPAVYLSYYVGYLEIMELRTLAEATLGTNFQLKEFHKFLLEIGPAPFEIIRESFLKQFS